MEGAVGTRSLIANVVVAAAIYTIDAWVIGQGGLMVLAALIAIGVALVRGAAAGMGRRWRGIPLQLGAVAVWVIFAIGTWVSIGYQARVAKQRADLVVAACKQFKAAEGRYPARLDELVPRFLPSVPRAKYTLMFGEFMYSSDPPPDGYGTSLMFVTIAPFMRTSYLFEQDRWVTID